MINKICSIDEKYIHKAISKFNTPFHIYDEKGILNNLKNFHETFEWCKMKEYFAVKATPTPKIMKLLFENGCGMDCSSYAELLLCEKLNLKGDQIIFTSNNTTLEEYKKAIELNAIINLDDFTHIKFIEDNLGKIPEKICFRFNPGELNFGNEIIGEPSQAKFGLTREQIIEGFKICKEKGSKEFGIHTMLVSNDIEPKNFISTAELIFKLVKEIESKNEIKISFINLGGGLGIPYKANEQKIDLKLISREIEKLYLEYFTQENPPQLMMENGRYITGPYGYLITKVIHKKNIYKNYLGVDSSMCDLMRPGMYGAYHHITILTKQDKNNSKTYDIVGSLCENNDKFAIDRDLPEVEIGDYLIIHDTGAHGHSMGFNYNGKLRCSELLVTKDNQIEMIRRAQTYEDYFSTLNF